MRFGPVATEQAEGTVLAHSLVAGTLRLKKGRVLSEEDIAALLEGGVREVVVAALEPKDIAEDDAAADLAATLAAPGLTASAPFTGRANLHAEEAGVLEVDGAAVAAFNGIDEAITLATLPPFARVRPRQMVATVKIIPYAAPGQAVADGRAALAGMPLRLHPFRLKTARLILTTIASLKPALVDKAQKSVTDRLATLGVEVIDCARVLHTAEAVASALSAPSPADLTLIFGASATSDRADACPAGLIAAGGTLTRFGMPVDPGNLLFLGRLGTRPVIGLPGCARSPALNGADWVLERIVAGLEVTSADIAAMGLGGLLKEIPTRPRPRDAAPTGESRPNVEVILLAAGRSSRMNGRDKLLEPVDGAPLLTQIARKMLESQADGVIAVLPPDRPERAAALTGLGLRSVVARDAATGMAASLRAGIAALTPQTEAAIIVLADMPDVTADHVNRLIAAFAPADNREIARATDARGNPGHPVLFARRFFETLAALEGDEGAKSVIAAAREYLVDVPTKGDGATIDLDTPQAWSAWRAARAGRASRDA